MDEADGYMVVSRREGLPCRGKPAIVFRFALVHALCTGYSASEMQQHSRKPRSNADANALRTTPKATVSSISCVHSTTPLRHESVLD